MPRTTQTAILSVLLALCFACSSDSLIKDKPELPTTITPSSNDVRAEKKKPCHFYGKVNATGDGYCPAKEVLLYTEGIRIMQNGKEFRIYGMDVDHHPLLNKPDKSSANSPYETLFTPDDMDFFAENGFNLVPLHNILMEEMIDGEGNINEAFFRNWIDVWVKWATQRKLYISIGMSSFFVPDMTWGVYPMPQWLADDYGGKPEGANWREQMRTITHGFYGLDKRSQSKREVYYQLWKYIANRYKHNPFVLYAPTNEPLHHTFQDFNPDESYWHKLARAYTNTMTQLIDHIREGEKGGFEKLVFVDRAYFKEGTFVDYQLPIERDNIVWEYHAYTDASDLSEWGSLAWWKNQVREGRDFFHAWNKPVHVGEWSTHNTVSPGFWEIERAYREEGGWKYIHKAQAQWLRQMKVSHSWFHYTQTAGEYWNVIKKRDGQRVLTHAESDFIFATLRNHSR